VNAEVASLHAKPGGRDDASRAKAERGNGTSQTCYLSPAGYQRRHGAKGHPETGEALDARRRKLGAEARPITVSGKWRGRRQGGGSGCSTVDPGAAKHTGREGPGPVDGPFGKARQG